jgi:hypothetical protein
MIWAYGPYTGDSDENAANTGIQYHGNNHSSTGFSLTFQQEGEVISSGDNGVRTTSDTAGTYLIL